MAEPYLEVPPYIFQWINKTYPKPKIDPAWVQQCYDWTVSSKGVAPDPPNYPKIIAEIQEQILKADLFDATIEGTGLPPQVASRETTMRIAGPPVLVQIKALTDIGISAFKLEEVRKAREERLQSGLGTEEDGEDEGDIEVEGEGPMPKYPRGTLMLELSDGTTTLKAMEYKPLPQLSLLTTPLGYKMQLKDVRVVLGVAHLEPRNITLLGGNSADNERRDYHFKQGLRQRLGLPLEPEPVPDGEGIQEEPEQPPPPPPPQRGGGGDAEPQGRIPSSTIPAPPPNVSPYFANRQPPSGSVPMNLPPTIRQAAPTLPAPSRSSPDFDDDFDMDDWAMLDEIEKAATSQAPPQPTPAPRAQPVASSSRTAPKPPLHPVDADLNLADDEDEGTVSYIAAEPKQSKFPHLLGKAPALCQPIQLAKTAGGTSTADDSDEYDIDDSLQLGSDDLRRLAEVEQQAASLSKVKKSPSKPSSSRPTASPTKKPTSTSNFMASKPKLKQPSMPPLTASPPKRRSRPPPSSQVRPGEIITISDSEGDSSVHLVDHIDMTQDPDTEADDKGNYAVAPTRHVRSRGDDGGPAVGGSQRQTSLKPPAPSQPRRRMPISLSDDAEVIEID